MLFLVAVQSFAQAPLCQKPADFDNVRQQAFLQNYFNAAFMLTPLGPMSAEKNASIGVELALIPPLSCEQRLVEWGSILKAENTNLSPVLPRPRIAVRLPNIGPIKLKLGAALIPPIPLPIGIVTNVALEGIVGYELPAGFDIGLRGHISLQRVRANMAPAVDPSVTESDDLFYGTIFGGDLGVALRPEKGKITWLSPFFAVGVATGQTLFIVGDDHQVVENARQPWTGATVSGGFQATLCNDH